MYLLELAVQGAKGFSPTGRFPLKPGYTVLSAPPPGQAPLVGLLVSLLYADGRGGDAAFASPGQKAKVGLTLLGNDQNTYRLLRELGGAGSLSRLNKQTQASEVVSQDAAEIGQFLRGQVGLPSRSAFEQLYCFSAAQLPSRRPKPKPTAAAKGKSQPQLATMRPVEAASDVGEAQRKVAELEEELERTQAVEQLQFRVDGVAQQLFELEGKLKGTEGLKAAVADAESALQRAPTPASYGLPEDIVERAERFPQVVAKRDRELAKIKGDAVEEVDLQARATPRYVPPVWLDQRFQVAMGGGVALFLAAVFAPGYWKYLGLLDIPAFFIAAVLAVQWVSELQDAERSTRKGGRAVSREKKILEAYEAESAPVLAAVKQVGVESPEELIQHLSQRPLYQAKVDELRGQLEELERQPEYAEAATTMQALRAEQEALNAEIQEKGAYVRDLREIERELSRTRESIALAETGSGATASPDPFAVPPAAELLEDPAPALLKLASDLFTTDVAGVATILKDRAAQYLSALTDRRCTGVEFDRNGRASAITPGGTVAAGELPARDLDALALALKLTVIEKHSARFKIPVLIDDGFSTLDEAKLPLLARMLKHVGTLTQVLHLTAHPGFAPSADANVRV